MFDQRPMMKNLMFARMTQQLNNPQLRAATQAARGYAGSNTMQSQQSANQAARGYSSPQPMQAQYGMPIQQQQAIPSGELGMPQAAPGSQQDYMAGMVNAQQATNAAQAANAAAQQGGVQVGVTRRFIPRRAPMNSQQQSMY